MSSLYRLIGTPPPANLKLVIFFDKDEYLSEFFNSKIRFGRLKRYQQLESSHGDSSEGIAYGYSDQGQFIHSKINNEIYVVCFTELNENTDFENLKARFSAGANKYLHISNINKFTQIVLSSFQNSIYKDSVISNEFQWFKVQYDERISVINKGVDPNISIYQKPMHKCRIVSVTSDGSKIYHPNVLHPDLEFKLRQKSDASYGYKTKIESLQNFSIEQEWRLVFWAKDKIFPYSVHDKTPLDASLEELQDRTAKEDGYNSWAEMKKYVSEDFCLNRLDYIRKYNALIDVVCVPLKEDLSSVAQLRNF